MIAILKALIGIVVKISAILPWLKSFLGVLLRVGNWFKVACLGKMVGSRFWGTATFMGLAAGLTVVISRTFSSIVSLILGLSVSSFDSSSINTQLQVVNFFVPASFIKDLVSFAVSIMTTFLIITKTKLVLKLYIFLMGQMKSSFKV